MWRDRDRYPEHNLVPDTFWLVIAVLLFAACRLVWLIGQVAAIVFGAHQHLPVRLVDMLGVLLRLPGTWDDPAQAWPPSSQPLLPGPVGMYAAAILTFWLPAFLYGLLVRLLSPEPAADGNAAPGGPVGGSCAGSWSLDPRRGRIILGRRDRIETASSAGCTWPSSNATRCWPSDHQAPSRPTAWSSRRSWSGRNLVTTSIKPDVLPPAPTAPAWGLLGLRPPRPVRRPRSPLDPLAPAAPTATHAASAGSGRRRRHPGSSGPRTPTTGSSSVDVRIGGAQGPCRVLQRPAATAAATDCT